MDYHYLGHIQFESNYSNFHNTTCIWGCHLQYGDYFVSDSVFKISWLRAKYHILVQNFCAGHNFNTSQRKISWSLEIARFIFRIVLLLWNLIDTSVALLPMCLSNFMLIKFRPSKMLVGHFRRNKMWHVIRISVRLPRYNNSQKLRLYTSVSQCYMQNVEYYVPIRKIWHQIRS